MSSPSLMDCLAKARADIAETYELDQEILDSIHQIVVNACKPILNAKPAAAGKPEKAAKVPRPKTAYNMFVHHHFQVNKANSKESNSQEIMSAVSKQWASLSDDQKAEYVKMAEKANETMDFSATPSKKPSKAGGKRRRITGYNLFYRENKDIIKESRSEGMSTMKAVGAAWHALTESARNEYNTRASSEADAASAVESD
jgi:hypothetical protein